MLGLALARDRRLGAHQTVEQDYGLGWEIWALLVFADARPTRPHEHPLVPLASTGSAPRARRSSGTCNPFLAAVFALILLDERMTLVQVAGGALIAGGILLRAQTGARTASE